MTREEATRLILIKADEIEQILTRWNPKHGTDSFRLEISRDWYDGSVCTIRFSARPADRNVTPIYYSEMTDTPQNGLKTV